MIDIIKKIFKKRHYLFIVKIDNFPISKEIEQKINNEPSLYNKDESIKNLRSKEGLEKTFILKDKIKKFLFLRLKKIRYEDIYINKSSKEKFIVYASFNYKKEYKKLIFQTIILKLWARINSNFQTEMEDNFGYVKKINKKDFNNQSIESYKLIY